MVLGPFYIGVEVLLPGHKGLRAISHSNLGGHVAVQVLEDGGGKSSWGTILLLLLLLLLERRLWIELLRLLRWHLFKSLLLSIESHIVVGRRVAIGILLPRGSSPSIVILLLLLLLLLGRRLMRISSSK